MSVVCEDDVASPELKSVKTGVDCKVKIRRKLWTGKVAAVGKLHVPVHAVLINNSCP